MTKFTEGQEVFVLIDRKMTTMTVSSEVQRWKGDTWMYLLDQYGISQRVHLTDIYSTNPLQEVFDFDLSDQDNNDE